MQRIVLFIGANHGLGLQFALQYLEKGFNVCGTYRKESAHEAQELLRSEATGAKTFYLDLADEASIQKASESFGDQPLDLLINCAAAGNGSNKCLDTTIDGFMHKFRVSAVGSFLTTRSFYPQLKKSDSPFVINISSSAGSINGRMSRLPSFHLMKVGLTRAVAVFDGNKNGGNLSYRTAKVAFNMIILDLAREHAPDYISCVAMSPGWVKTKMTGFTGTMETPEAVALMIKVIEGLKPSDTAIF